jgi:hypothetical protein
VNERREFLPEGYFYSSERKERTLPEHVIRKPKPGPAFDRLADELAARKARTTHRARKSADTKAKILARKNAFRARKGLPPLPTK